MTITIFCMLASIALLIFIPIYLKNKNNFYKFQKQDKVDIRKQKKNIKNIFGIDEIENGIITSNNSNSIIIELGSIEYRLLNNEEQENIDICLTNLSKTFSFQSQFFSTIEKIDTTTKIQKIRENIEKQNNYNIKEYGQKIIEYLEDIMQEENLHVRKNYFIITSKEQGMKAKTELEDIYQNLKYSLTNIRVKVRMLSNIEILELIHKELNKNTNEKIEEIIGEGGLELYVHSKMVLE